MDTAHLVVTIVAVVANAFSGVCAIARLDVIREPMARVGVPESWLVFPIGTLKLAGAAGLLLGLLGVPLIGTTAAIGLILYFAVAVGVHVRARDYSPQLAAAGGFFLPIAAASLSLGLITA